MKIERIVNKQGEIYAFEILLGRPMDGSEDLENVLRAIEFTKDDSLYHINIYPKTLMEYSDLIASKINSKNIVFELVEVNSTACLDKLNEVLCKYNFWISIDDFGVGSSNFDRVFYLKNIKSIKIDRELWKNIDSKLIREFTNLFKKKGILDIVAEKVEKEKEYEYLKNLGY